MRARRAQGRPGTVVIPADWSESHQPVVARSWTGTCTIYGPGTTGSVELDIDLALTVGAEPAALHVGGCRVQQLNSKETVALVADQDVTGVGYLVVVAAAVDVPLGSVVAVSAADDTTLPDRRLVVVKVGRGTELWERDLYCIEDQSAAPAVEPEPEPEGP